MTAATPSGLFFKLRNVAASRSVMQSALAAGSQFAAQAIRFGSNVILASLLSPAIFGILAIVTTVRTGIELLTDMGINQSIVVSKDGDEQRFVETAWGLQILRGFVLAALGAATAFPLAALYDQSEGLGMLLLIASVGSIIAGMARPGPAVLQRHRKVGRVVTIRIARAAATAGAAITVVLFMPTALGVVLGNLIGISIYAVLCFLIHPMPGYVPRLDPEYRSKIITFGKWIFLSSVIYFFAQNFDRLYLPLTIPLAIFGIYGISRSISEIVVQTVTQVNQLVVLPAVARSADDFEQKRPRLARIRFAGLAVIAAGLGLLTAIADLIILTIFDDRYALGATILPILFIGSWFAILASVNQSVLMGLSQTRPLASSNGVRLLTAVIGLPLAFGLGGLPAGLVVIALADLPRYLWLLWAASRHRVAFPLQDIALIAVLAGAILLFREAVVLLGLVDGFVSSTQSAGIAELSAVTGPSAR